MPDTAQSSSSPAHKRSRLDSLLHLASATPTPDNSLPRRRKEVTRRTDQEARTAEDVQMGEHELSTYQSGFTQSHANLVSTLTREPSPGASVPRPLYFEVPCSPSGAGPLVGRGWVWHEAATQLFRPPQLETSCTQQQLAAGRGVLITGGPGAGKTAAVLALVQASCFGQPQSDSEIAHQSEDPSFRQLSSIVVGYHFCQASVASSCGVAGLVHSLAAQLAQAPQLSAAQGSNSCPLPSWSSCCQDPAGALLQLLAPLQLAKGQLGLVLVDGLDEAEQHRPDYGPTIASFLATNLHTFPPWLRIVATTRSGVDTVRLPFHTICLDGPEDERVRRDITDYISSRRRATRLVSRGGRSSRLGGDLAAKFSSFLATQAAGCFLYAKLVLDLVERGKIAVKAASFKVVPHSLAEVFQLMFSLKYSTSCSYSAVSSLLSILLASLEPLTEATLHAAHSALYCGAPALSATQVRDLLSPLAELVVTRSDGSLMCIHPTLRDWLQRRLRPQDSETARRFVCDVRSGHAALALHLARQPPQLATTDILLARCHHLLKSHLFKQCPNTQLSPRQLQACFTSLAADEVTAALACPRNLYSPLVKVSRLLLLAGADPNHLVTSTSCCLLAVHCSRGHTDMVRLLLEYGAEAGEESLVAASGGGHLDTLQLLLSSQLPGGPAVTAAAVAAAAAGHTATLEWLLAQETSCQAELGSRALVAALLHGQGAVVDTLLDTQPLSWATLESNSGLSCLEAAAKVGQLDTVRRLLAREPQDSSTAGLKEAAVRAAASFGHAPVLSLLLGQGAGAGAGHLQEAAAGGHLECVAALLEAAPALLDQADTEGLTPLTHAILNNQPQVAALLLQRGASLDTGGRSALDIAIYQGSPAMVELLLDSGANMEQADTRGIKPLDRVIGHGSAAIVSVFLRKGAKLGAATWVMARDQPDIQLLLLNKLMEDGNTLYRQGKLGEAGLRYKYGLKRLASIPRAECDWAAELETRLLLNLARVERRRGRHGASMQLASRVLQSQPSCAQALCTRAKAARSLGLYREAFEDFNTALELMPGNAQLRRVILKMKEGFRSEMSSSFMSFCSSESIKFIDDCSVDMETQGGDNTNTM